MLIQDLSNEERADLQDWVFNTLRHEFGRQIDPDWSHEFTNKLLCKADSIVAEHAAAAFAARNKKIEELINNDDSTRKL